ncbi:MAG: hypothetical protein A3F11_05030 [Gammaproteobacteria bacterium RIFCSPHIGHO2_12_FULL_37_14]|nr:MAG: hypothetical protein A3F11_05030 [Gammaproteobacteria bacterium RIFCSPHIGHO2_12_FULL_37_14]
MLTVLDKEYLLEDTDRNYPTELTEYDTTRWSRNIEFFGAYCKANDNKYSYQEKLKNVRLAVLGLGGVGSNILYNLVAMGIHNIVAVDFDKVELSNLNRQIIYNESDIGQLKSEAAKNRISQFLSANIQFINKKMTNSEDIADVIAGQDIAISAIDHPREKIMDWVNMACVKHNIPFLCGSLDSKLVTDALSCMSIFYVRFQDDVLALCKSKRQLNRCRKRMMEVLHERKLRLSRKKSRMGSIDRGFHYLGVDYLPTQPEDYTTVTHANDDVIVSADAAYSLPKQGGGGII